MDWISWSTDLIDKEYDDKEQETSETKTEVFALKTNVLAFASRPKAKANHEDLPLLAHLQELYLIVKEDGLILNHELNPILRTQVAKRSNTLLRHGQLPREEDGAIEFWRIKDDLRNEFEYPQHWSDEIWKSKMARRRRQQEKISILYWLVRTRNSLSPSSSRSFRTQSHWSYTSGQCVNSGQFLRVYLSYWMCN